MKASCTPIAVLAIITLLAFPSLSDAQYGPNCPILGAVFLAPKDVLKESEIIPNALSNLQDTLQKIVENATLFDKANTSFHLNLFSEDDNLLSFGHAGTNLTESALPAGTLNEDTIFRIGSISKLVTVYALLAEVGMDRMRDAVTTWVPELANVANTGSKNVVGQVGWEDVTIGALASHQAGLDRDFSLADLALRVNATTAEQNALPPLAPNEIPSCGLDILLPPCSRTEFFKGMEGLHPVTSVFHTPIYSNIAFQILAYAVEGMANKSFTDIFQSSIIERLGLKRTSLQPPQSTKDGIIPENELSSWWNLTTGDATPYGGMFSSGRDMAVIGRSILNSTLLEPALTRKWLHPVTHTADLHVAVGMPWEIHRLLLPISPEYNYTRVVDLYTKNGQLGGYAALFVLSPEHNFGFSLLLASPTAPTEAQARLAAMTLIGDVVTYTMVSAFEQAARDQASRKFAGTYASSNMTLAISVNSGHPGLKISNWTMGSENVLELYSGSPDTDARLYPIDLAGGGKIAFRAVYEPSREAFYTAQPGIVFSRGCLPWGDVASPQYGNIAFDDFVFDVNENGEAIAISPRVTRQTLLKVE
ncbi:beta-lactamase/transpeptidase-like protein [Xylariaceae sp. FL1651]|nr:beta-lactamase/transpeptidase-like protein [Xylariaceae sp. FL1651]